jgi:hypothetical protein
MTVDEIISRFGVFASVVGEKWLRQSAWCDTDYISSRIDHYKRLEMDLKRIDAFVGRQSLTKAYRSLLHDQNSFWNILHEIHGIALVAKGASSLELKIPLGGTGNRDFDARANILGASINIECTTRQDEFPFNFQPTEVGPKKIRVYSGSRATVDPHDLGIAYESHEQNHVATPEATVVRQILSEELSQLPKTGINLVILGQRAGNREDLETALFGPVAVDFWSVAETKEVESAVVQLPHGAYDAGANGESFRGLSGVLWFKLFNMTGPQYALYPNPNATNPLPQEVAARLESVIS